jgi:hypothetical protein
VVGEERAIRRFVETATAAELRQVLAQLRKERSEMRGLTITQPWATLIAIGAKRYETREWKTGYRGLVAIHAAKKYPMAAAAFAGRDPYGCLRAAGLDSQRLPLGVVVAVAELAFCVPTEPFGRTLVLSDQERTLGDYSPGRYAFVLKNVRRLERPVAARGALGLWDVPEELEAAILAQLEEAVLV